MLSYMFKNNTTCLNSWLLSELSSGSGREKKKKDCCTYRELLLSCCFILPYAYYVKWSGTTDAVIIQLHTFRMSPCKY